jgi:hypothetical protein
MVNTSLPIVSCILQGGEGVITGSNQFWMHSHTYNCNRVNYGKEKSQWEISYVTSGCQ